jgi:photosystem II stability/assembly factor-like uncharacterized protein
MILRTVSAGANWEIIESSTRAWLEDVKFVSEKHGIIAGDKGTILVTLDGGLTWSRVKTNARENLNALSFYDEKIGYAVGANGIILKTTDGGLSWIDSESPARANLYAVLAVGRGQAIAVGELGTVLVTDDGGRTWQLQSNITGKVLQAISFQGGTDMWVGGRGGTILKRIAPLTPNAIGGPRVAPVLRPAIRTKPRARTPLITVTDDGDIPIATPPKKEQ